MDWGKFLQDYGASLFTAAGVILGIVATTIVSILRNRFEASEREKERAERQMELTTTLHVELLRADIATVTQSIDNALKTIDFLSDLRLKQDIGKITQEERIEQMRIAQLEDTGKLHQLSEVDSVSVKLTHAFGKDFCTEMDKFDDACLDYMRYIKDRESYMDKEDLPPEDTALYDKVGVSAANLHLMLRDMLVSVRRGQMPEQRKNWLQRLCGMLEL